MATLVDIANMCGVSKTTVSRVLNNDPDFSVSDKTRENILAAADSLEYNFKSKSRPQKKKGTSEKSAQYSETRLLKIGIVCFDKNTTTNNDNYYDGIFHNITEALKNSNSDYPLEFQYILKPSYEELKGLDGFIALGKVHLDPFHPYITAIKYKVFVDYVSPGDCFDSVRVDFAKVVQTAIDHFHTVNLHDIGFVGSYDYITHFPDGEKVRALDARHVAFNDYCLQNNINPAKRIWIADYFSPECGYNMTKQIITEGDLPPALVYASDEMALGSYRAFQESGIEIGKDISIIAIDDLPYASFLAPPLTTISLNLQMIGSTVALALISQLQGRDYPLTMFSPTQLIVRSSCKLPNK